MKPTRRLFTSLKVRDDAGKELLNLQEGLVSVQLPLQPAFVNPGFYPALEANLWRHTLTKWYDDELVLLDDLRRDGADYAADNLEVLLYGTFAKTAEEMGRRQLLRKSAYPKFKQSFNAFVREYGRPPLCPGVGLYPVEGLSPTEYLELIDCNSYMGWRIALLGFA